MFFRALAVTVGMALLTSLALALTWTPTLSHYFLRSRRAARSSRSSTIPCRRWLMHVYERTLRFALEHHWCWGCSPSLLIAGSYFCYNAHRVRPAARHGRRRLHRRLHHAGRRSLRETNRVITHVEKILRDTPEVENTSRRTGLQLGLATVTEANTGDISVKLKP